LETCFLLLKKSKSYDGSTVQNEDASERLLEDLIDNRTSNINENVSNVNVKKCLTITFTDAVDTGQTTYENITIIFNSPKEIKIS
jgi:hypothetical protein